MLKIAVLVSGGGTNLQALIDAEKAGKIKNGTIVKVIASKEGAYALTRAANAGIETAVVARKSFENPEITTRLSFQSLKSAVLTLWSSQVSFLFSVKPLFQSMKIKS